MDLYYMSASGTAYLFRHAADQVGDPVDILLHSTIKVIYISVTDN